ncbi:MAG: hypothetical protein UZ07_CHB004000071 [Chlorobi bacterium OLB7]|nr:MAG: hypothetical protein UZ07_CHB004000071 [Chlorobi bacterium OLB7]
MNDWLIVSHDGSYRLKLDEWQLLTGQLYRKISLFTDRPRETGDTLYLLDKDKGDTIQTIIYGPLPKGEPYRL